MPRLLFTSWTRWVRPPSSRLTLSCETDQEAIDDGSALQDALEQLNGQRTVPNVYIGQQHIGGNSEVQALDKKGELQPLLKKAGVLA